MYFSTRGFDRSDRLAAWQDALADQCSAFLPEAKADGFEASIEVRDVGSLRCARVMQASGLVRRTDSEIHLRPTDEYIVVLQLTGATRMRQGNRLADLTPGQVTVIDLAQPSLFEFDRKSIQLVLHIPKSRFADWDAASPPQFAITMSRLSAALIGPLMSTAFDRVAGAIHHGEAVCAAILHLVSAEWSLDRESAEEAVKDYPALLRSIQDFALNHLDEDISPSMLARMNKMSDRSLHRMFAAHGLSVCGWLRQSRLDRCAADLRDERQHGRTITDIASGYGFFNAAHFTRSFRAQFGQTPRDYRTAARDA